LDKLAAGKCENHSLSNFETLVSVAAKENYISEAEIKKLLAFQKNPSDPSWME
jgi:orotate phosphoribosyltransferase